MSIADDLMQGLGLSDPVIRLGVTGLSRAGKTVFITSLVANLLDRGRMAALRAGLEGVVARGKAEQAARQLAAKKPLSCQSTSSFGFSAKATLGLAQALYEKHKVLTYPRTDARALPEDYLGTVKDTLRMLTGEGAGKGHDETILSR
mgnify:CR=1 FL=1